MALIKCPECGSKISSQAASCPNCGYAINTANYGRDLGGGIKEGLKGLNTVASPKKRKTCIILTLIPILSFLILTILVNTSHQSDFIIGLFMIPIFTTGLANLYTGKFKRGLLYFFTIGIFMVGLLSDLFKLTVTKTFKDSNGFPVIY